MSSLLPLGHLLGHLLGLALLSHLGVRALVRHLHRSWLATGDLLPSERPQHKKQHALPLDHLQAQAKQTPQ